MYKKRFKILVQRFQERPFAVTFDHRFNILQTSGYKSEKESMLIFLRKFNSEDEPEEVVRGKNKLRLFLPCTEIYFKEVSKKLLDDYEWVIVSVNCFGGLIK